MKPNFFMVGRAEEPSEILRVTAEGAVYMRMHPHKGKPGELVKVSLTRDEIDRLRDCTELMDAIGILAGIIARLSHMN